ncbi:MAG: ATP-binding protein [Bacteroidales bacterium]|nr:ATP-binding protein [Bacteroidales bacterium]
MNVQIDNPFLITGYESPEYFCDREKETEDLMETLGNGRNVTLMSPRRLGKTGLIKHLYHLLRQKDSKVTVIYIDLYPTESLHDFTQAFASAVLGQLDADPVRLMKKIVSLFKSFRPYMTADPVTGQPKLGLDVVPGSESGTLEQVFHYLKQSGKTCYIAFDEFQQIAYYPENHVEALLRSHIQDLHNVHFIFSGSQEHLLGEMFLSPKRPFYQSTSEKTIGAIDEKAYYAFAASFFQGQGRILPEEVFHQVYSQYEGYTWYIQMILNRLYAKSTRPVDAGLVQESILDILQENEFYYQHLLQAYPRGQVKLVKAIAKEKKVKEITSGAFITKYGLTATSSVKSALVRMLEDEIIYHDKEGFMVYDRFFGQWLDAMF